MKKVFMTILFQVTMMCLYSQSSMFISMERKELVTYTCDQNQQPKDTGMIVFIGTPDGEIVDKIFTLKDNTLIRINPDYIYYKGLNYFRSGIVKKGF